MAACACAALCWSRAWPAPTRGWRRAGARAGAAGADANGRNRGHGPLLPRGGMAACACGCGVLVAGMARSYSGMAACGCGVLRCVGRGHGPLLLGDGGVRVRGRERLVLMRMAGIAGMAACGCGVLCWSRAWPAPTRDGGARVRGRERLVLMRMAGIAGMARSYSGWRRARARALCWSRAWPAPTRGWRRARAGAVCWSRAWPARTRPTAPFARSRAHTQPTV
jgi:hypothetical protein